MKIYIKWEWRDLWFGVFIDKPRWTAMRIDSAGIHQPYESQRTYICIIPCLPIVIERRRNITKKARHASQG